MSKHTPGPWDLHSDDEADGHFRVRGSRAGCKFKVANVPYMTPTDDYGWSRKEALANAALIAEAPEMLDVIKSVYEAFTVPGGDMRAIYRRCRQVLDRIEASAHHFQPSKATD